MKFVAQGVVKQQEYFFCYFLTLLGVDVLLLQNEVDIEEKLDALQLSRQVVLGEKGGIKHLPACVQPFLIALHTAGGPVPVNVPGERSHSVIDSLS